MAFEFTQIASLGLGAVIAVIVLNWKRDDDRKYADALKTLTCEGDKRFDKMVEAFQANTQALDALRDALDHTQRAEQMVADLERRLMERLEEVNYG